MSGGADTEIGERGINVSGGQKARISLARALYSQADIYLLDDPLSAVDPDVADKLFHDCINGYLQDKCRILVTHQIQFLKEEKNICLIEDGKIKLQGSYAECCEKGVDFDAILEAYEPKEEHEEDEIVVSINEDEKATEEIKIESEKHDEVEEDNVQENNNIRKQNIKLDSI
jgi:ATP-binding cassette subfamily C (CFTR/MRP) protein 4